MREIKFRAWDKHNKCMVEVINLSWYWKDVVGASEMVIGIGDKEQKITRYGMKDFELMQYTGLKDKFGQEIYEGDLAKWVDSDGVDRVDVVRYSRIGAKFFICNSLFEINDYYPVKIIGNIHENPKLLKEVR